MRKQIVSINEAPSEERVYKINADPRILDELEEVLSAIQTLGHVGASRTLSVFVDGDGATRIKVVRSDKTPLKSSEINTDNDTIILSMG